MQEKRPASAGKRARQRPPRPGGVARTAGRLCAVLLLACSFGTPRAAEAANLYWDEYLSLRRLLRENPDAAHARAESLLALDTDDFLGAWLKGAWCAAAKERSSGAAGCPAVRSIPAHAGSWVTAATIRFADGAFDEGRASLDRACQAYEGADRGRDAGRSLLWKIILRPDGRRDPAADPALMGDLAATEAAARQNGDPETLANTLLLKAAIARESDPPSVAPLCEEAIALLAPLGPGVQLMQGHRTLAIAHKRAGDIDAAERHYREALNLARALGDRVQESRATAGLAQIAKARGALEEALELQAQARAIAVATGSQEDVASRESEIGTLHTQLGHYRAAREHLQDALRIGEAGNATPDELVLMRDGLASVAALTGDLETARREWDRAVAICRERDLRGRLPFLLLHLSQLHMDIGEPARAREMAEEGLAVARAIGHRRAELPLLSSVAAAQLALGDHAAALTTARGAADLARRIEPRYLWEIARGEAAALQGLGRTAEALAVLDSTIARFPEIPDSMRLGLALRLAGNLEVGNGSPQRGEALLRQSLAVARAMRDRRREAYAEIDLGKAKLSSGAPAEAVAWLERGLRYIEDERARIAVSDERGGYQSRWYDDYVALAQAQACCGKPAEALATLERTRARELRELYGTRTPGLRAQVPEDLAHALERVEAELAEMQTALYVERTPAPGPRAPGLLARERRADSLKTAWTDLTRQIERAAPAYSRAAGVRAPVSAAEVQRALRPGERLIAYMVGTSGFLVFDVRATGLRVTHAAIGEATLTDEVNRFVASLLDPDASAWHEPAARLGEQLLGNCRLADDPPQRLYILPDGILHHVPFEALVAPDATRKCLLEQTEVVYANSATLLLRPAVPRTPAGSAAPATASVFADPIGPAVAGADAAVLPPRGLPFAREEAQGIAARLPGTQLYLGADAREDRFFTALRQAPIVHVAAHAIVDDEHPAFSGIALAPGADGSDGWVRAHEVLEHSCPVELAVLSACETGRGRLLRGEGLLGLARAFCLAGVRNLLVTLWKVDDRAAADLMAEFYTRLSAGAAPSTALRDAKLARWRRGTQAATDAASGTRGVGRRTREAASQAPSTWAAFVLIGSRVE